MADEGLISLEEGSSSAASHRSFVCVFNESRSTTNRGRRRAREQEFAEREEPSGANSMDMNGESFSRLNDCVSICIVGGGERRGKERRGEQGGS